MENAFDENWKVLLSLLPAGWEEQARQCGALRRLRGFDSCEAMLRTLLLHMARGYSLRETVVQAKAAGIAQVSDVALLKRLRQAEGWLRELCQALLRENQVALPNFKAAPVLRLVDATVVKEPGPTGSQWRFHYSLQVPSLVCDFLALTPTQGEGTGESFRWYPVASREFILGDAGYCTPAGVEHVAQRGAYVLVRLNTSSLPLKSRPGRPWDLRSALRSLPEAGQVGEWAVWVQGPHRGVEGRLCALRKSEHNILKAHRRLRRQASKKGSVVQSETLEFAKYVLVFTTFPRQDFSAQKILQVYRVRWQIELVFKRLKSLAQLGHLPKHDERSSRAWLYGKMLVALLTQKMVRMGREFSPWGYPLSADAGPQ